MRLAGLILTALGVLILLVAFNLETSVASVSAAAAADGFSVPQRVADPTLLQRQIMLLHCALAAIVGGIVLFVGGELARRLGTPVAGEREALDPSGPVAATARGPERALTRRDMLIGGGIVGAILIILFAFSLFGRGGGGSTDGYTVVNALNASDSELIGAEEPDPEAEERARAAAAARRARAEEANRAAAEPAPAETPPPVAEPAPPATNGAQPQLPPADPVANGQ